MNRIFRIFIGLLLLAAWTHPLAAQNILPASFAGWTANARSTAIPDSGLEQLVGANSVALREYVVKGIEQRPYTQGNQTVSITLYRLRDPSSAYGAYTLLRPDSMMPTN